MMRRLLRWLDPFLGFLALALLWQVSVEVFNIRPYLLPSIGALAESAFSLYPRHRSRRRRPRRYPPRHPFVPVAAMLIRRCHRL